MNTFVAWFIIYIDNPVHHGFAHEMTEWVYSSYHSFMTDKATRIEKERTLGFLEGKKGLLNITGGNQTSSSNLSTRVSPFLFPKDLAKPGYVE